MAKKKPNDRNPSARESGKHLDEPINKLYGLLKPLIDQIGEPKSSNGGNGAGETELSDYNNSLGDFLKFPDDLKQTYSGVLMQVYPLQADLERLGALCKAYFFPEEASYGGYSEPGKASLPLLEIRPAAPWAFMIVADYGKMALQSQNIGWVSQREVAFGFPVALYKRDKKDAPGYFVDWALVYPFNYVDNPVSMSLGRQVYGWPKAGMEIRSARANLSPDLRCLATVDRYSGPERSVVGGGGETRFLEVFQRQPLLSGRAGAASYFNYLARMSADYMSLVSTSFGMVRSASNDWRKNPPRTINSMVGQFGSMTTQFFTGYDYIDGFLKSASRMARARRAALQTPFGNPPGKYSQDSELGKVKIVTLKQFRDAETPKASCYRAIVLSTMGYSQPTDGAFFVSDPLSEASGGVLINICNDGPQDIVESLGLQGCINFVQDGSRTIHTLEPVMPFWAKVDLTYDSADSQWSRTKYTEWLYDQKSSDGGIVYHTPGPDETTVPYTTVGSGASQELTGPLKSANFGLQVYCLDADQGTLQKLLDHYLNSGTLKDPGLLGQDYFRFEVTLPSPDWAPHVPAPIGGAYVLMIVSSFDELSSDDKNSERRNLHDRVLTFAVPATQTYLGNTKNLQANPQKRDIHDDQPVLIHLFTFVEQDWDFLTEYEVYGRFALKSDLDSPPKNWIDDVKHRSDLLNVYSTIFPGELGTPQSAQVMPIVQISKSNDPPSAKPRAGKQKLHVDEYATLCLTLMGLKPKPVANNAALVSIGLKQVRDAIKPKLAAYQEIVSVERDFDRVWQEGNYDTLGVYIYSYAGFDIVRTMGITCGQSEWVYVDGKKRERHYVETKAGAKVSGNMNDASAQSLCWSISKGDWNESSSS